MITLFITTFTASAQNIDNLKYIIAQSIDYRTRMENIYEHLVKLNGKDYVLVEKDISYLNKNSLDRSRFENAVFAYLDDLDYTVKKRIKKSYSPTDSQFNDTVAYLAVSLTMYDSFLTTYLKINKLKKIRRFLNTADSAIGKKKKLFKKTIARYTSFKFRRRLKRGIKAFRKVYGKNPEAFSENLEITTMAKIINESYTYTRLVDQNFWGATKDFFKLLGRKFNNGLIAKSDQINRIGKNAVFYISQAFGNTVGLLQFRNGHLYNDPDFLKQILDYSEPLDIILEKTPFRVTDRFIPGYWGHAAIYIGNEVQLRELEIWDHPMVEKYHERIKMGKTIVEALRSGVELNSYKHFTQVDDFALLRQNEKWEQVDAGEHIVRALSQVGKAYDFEFDVETPTAIVCSELHYTVFRNLTFNTTNILNRNTISVDQVSYQGYSGSKFTPHILYIDGVEIKENIQAVYDTIIDDAKGEIKLEDDSKKVAYKNESLLPELDTLLN